jgi:hypothetical protein
VNGYLWFQSLKEPISCAPCTEKVTSIFKKFKKVACHQFVAPLGYEAALGSRVEKNNKSSEGIKIG